MAAHLEDRHCTAQRISLVGHCMRCCGGFFHQRSVLLCDFFNLANGHVDLLNAGALFQRMLTRSPRRSGSPAITEETLVDEHGPVLAGGLRAIHRTICAAQDGGDVEWFASRVG